MAKNAIQFGTIIIKRPDGKGPSIKTTNHVNSELSKINNYSIRARRESNSEVALEYRPEHELIQKILSLDDNGNNTTRHRKIDQIYVPQDAPRESIPIELPQDSPQKELTIVPVYESVSAIGQSSRLMETLAEKEAEHIRQQSAIIYSTLDEVVEKIKALPKPESVLFAEKRLEYSINVPKEAFDPSLWQKINEGWNNDKKEISRWESGLEGITHEFPVWIALTGNGAVVTPPLLSQERYRGSEMIRETMEGIKDALQKKEIEFEFDTNNRFSRLTHNNRLSNDQEDLILETIKEHFDCYLQEAKPCYVVTRFYSPQESIDAMVERAPGTFNTNEYLKGILENEYKGLQAEMMRAFNLPRSQVVKINHRQNLTDEVYEQIAPYVSKTVDELIAGKQSMVIRPIPYEGTFEENYDGLSPQEMVKKDCERFFSGNRSEMTRYCGMPKNRLIKIWSGSAFDDETHKMFNQMYRIG